MIIGIHGRKQCGKDSMARFVKDILPEKTIQQIAFAKPLKDFVHECFQIDKKHLYGTDAEKDYPLCTWGEVFTGRALTKYKKASRDLLSAREIMQLWGTDVVRQGHLDFLHARVEKETLLFLEKKFGPKTRPFNDVWVDLAMMDVKILTATGEVDIFMISDMRFTNEFYATQKNGGKTVRLYRDTPTTESIVHESERELEEIPDKDFNFVLKEEDNVNLKQLKTFTIKVLMGCGLLATGGVVV